MGSWLNQRNAAAGGILSMVLLVVGNFIYGQPPKFAASQSTIADFFHQHHRTVLIGMVLTGLAIPLYVWFVAHLSLAVGGPLGAAIALGGVLVAATAATGDALTAALAHSAKIGGDTGSMRLVYEITTIAYSRLFWAGIALAVPLAVAVGRGALRPWVGYVAWAQAIVFLLAGLSLKWMGFFSPTGGMALIGYLVYFAGTAAFAFGLWQSSPATADAPHAATTPV